MDVAGGRDAGTGGLGAAPLKSSLTMWQPPPPPHPRSPHSVSSTWDFAMEFAVCFWSQRYSLQQNVDLRVTRVQSRNVTRWLNDKYQILCTAEQTDAFSVYFTQRLNPPQATGAADPPKTDVQLAVRALGVRNRRSYQSGPWGSETDVASRAVRDWAPETLRNVLFSGRLLIQWVRLWGNLFSFLLFI